RYEAAEQVRLVAERLWQTVRLGRGVGRALVLGRQLEAQMGEMGPSPTATAGKKDDHRVMVRAAHTLLSLRQLYATTRPGEEGEGLERITVVNTLRNELVTLAERAVLGRAQQVVREFSMSSLLSSSQQSSTYTQTEDTKARAISALTTLYLLSPTNSTTTPATFEPTLLIQALQTYLQTALTSSLAALTRALATLPTLDRTLLEISARCQNIVALEALLESTAPPSHPLFPSPVPATPSAGPAPGPPQNFLQPLLHALDTASLPSYFWRSLASALSARVQDIMNRGGVSARTLRTNRDRVKDAVRECVDRGSQLPAAGVLGRKGGLGKVGGWEREAAVM
ncbi:hypothetical protein LTR28_002764, partial [Elasticomyces elasticus]